MATLPRVMRKRSRKNAEEEPSHKEEGHDDDDESRQSRSVHGALDAQGFAALPGQAYPRSGAFHAQLDVLAQDMLTAMVTRAFRGDGGDHNHAPSMMGSRFCTVALQRMCTAPQDLTPGEGPASPGNW